MTADQAIPCAESVMASLEDGAFYVDVNSISPQAKCRIRDIVAEKDGRFVEASVMSPIFPLRSKAPILLGGDHAQAFLKLAEALPLSNLSVASTQWGVAAATKMCRSVVVKGIEALVTESLLSARHYGVESTVLASLSNLFPRDDWETYAKYLIAQEACSTVSGVQARCEKRQKLWKLQVSLLDESCYRRPSGMGAPASAQRHPRVAVRPFGCHQFQRN